MGKASFHLDDREMLLYADGELTAAKSSVARDHLADCGLCRSRLQLVRSTLSETVGAGEEWRSSPEDAAGARANLKSKLREAMQYEPAAVGFQFHFARMLACACALALVTVVVIEFGHSFSGMHQSVYARSLPDPVITPGSTRKVKLADLCSSATDDAVLSVATPLQERIFQEYGLKGQNASDFEVDYLITPGLGGSDDVRNLWPEPHHDATWNSYVKDQLESHLHSMVCDQSLSLDEAQRAIATDWIAAYKKYFHTDRPLSKPLSSEVADPKASSTQLQASAIASSRWMHLARLVARSAKGPSDRMRSSAATAFLTE